MTLEIQHGLIHSYKRALKVVSSKMPEEVMAINSDKIAVWGEGFKSFLMEAGNQASSIEITGNPRFDSFLTLSEKFNKKDFISSNFNFDIDCKVSFIFLSLFP